jgi:glutathione reductase (NADPH)
VNVGCVPQKFMVMAAEYGLNADDAPRFGWDVAKGRHDWAKLIAAKDVEIARLNGIYRALLHQADVRIYETRAVFVDEHTLDVGGERITAERIVIATGGHPVRPELPGGELAIVSDAAFYLAELPPRVAIIGGGYIGVEFAGIFAGLGAETHLIYRQPLPLRGFDADLRIGLAEALRDNGVVLHPDTTPTSIMEDENGKTLALSDLSILCVDLVFFATGRTPNVGGLGLETVGVALTDTGAVRVDEDLATNVPHIYAIGDVTDRVNLTPVATAEGHALADSLFGPGQRRVSLEHVPSAVFSIPPVATVGIAEALAPKDAKIFLTKFTPMRHNLTKRARKSLMKVIVQAETDKVLGIHMLGEDAPEIIQGLAVAMTAGATKADFDRTIGIHPTAAEEFVTLRTQTRVVAEEVTGE